MEFVLGRGSLPHSFFDNHTLWKVLALLLLQRITVVDPESGVRRAREASCNAKGQLYYTDKVYRVYVNNTHPHICTYLGLD